MPREQREAIEGSSVQLGRGRSQPLVLVLTLSPPRKATPHIIESLESLESQLQHLTTPEGWWWWPVEANLIRVCPLADTHVKLSAPSLHLISSFNLRFEFRGLVLDSVSSICAAGLIKSALVCLGIRDASTIHLTPSPDDQCFVCLPIDVSGKTSKSFLFGFSGFRQPFGCVVRRGLATVLHHRDAFGWTISETT